jgi:phosphatidylglycerophosphatase A
MDILIKILASGFGLGYIPFAPGTFGTLGGVALFLLLALFNPTAYIVSAVVLFFIASMVSKKAEIIFNKKDSRIIVIDEISGFIVTMMLIEPSLHSILLGFIYFRFFDIVKIWPAKSFDNMSGGFAVVLDDIAAGIYANVLLRISLNYLPAG